MSEEEPDLGPDPDSQAWFPRDCFGLLYRITPEGPAGGMMGRLVSPLTPRQYGLLLGLMLNQLEGFIKHTREQQLLHHAEALRLFEKGFETARASPDYQYNPAGHFSQITIAQADRRDQSEGKVPSGEGGKEVPPPAQSG